MEKTLASRLGAVAVGLGMAMAGGSGIAHATTDSDTSPSSASSQRSDTESNAHSKPEYSDRQSSSTKTDTGPQRSDDDDDSDRPVERDTDGSDDSDNDPVSDESTTPRKTNSTDRDKDKDTDEAEAAVDASADAGAVTDAGAETDADAVTDTDIDEPSQDAPDGTGGEIATTEPVPASEQVAPSSASASPVRKATSERAAQSATVHGVNADSSPDTTPAAPAGALAWMTSVASWLQREVDYFVHGGAAPVSDPRQVVFDPSNGAMHGTLHAVGDHRDRLTFELVAGPEFGTVHLSPEGGYVYTPGEFPTEGVADTFTVAVRNYGFNLPTLMGLLNPSVNTTTVAVGVQVPVTATPSNQAENEFHVYNFTSHTLRLSRTDRVNVQPSGPPVGDVLDPGEFHRFHLEFFSYTAGAPSYTLNYTSVDNPDVQYAITLHQNHTTLVSDSWISCQGGCLPTGNFGGQTVAMVDAPGTRIDVYADQAQKQGDVLGQLCVESSTLTCSFTVTSRENVDGDLELVDSIVNSANHPLSFSAQFKTTLTNKSSVQTGVKASAKILAVLTAEVAQQFGDEITTTSEVTSGYDLSIAPGTIETIYVQHGMIRYTGDFTVKAGNTSWVLHNVHFDTLEGGDNPPVTWTRTNNPITPGQVEAATTAVSI